MKKNYIIPFIMFLTVYLLGSFYSVSFNIDSWERSTRSVVAGVGGFLFFASFIGVWVNNSVENINEND